MDGEELRAKIVGEGANLGATQRGRVAYALAGGRINTDAIDNSAGVDLSDHEVNLKILIDRAIAAGALPAEERDMLLAGMTQEVAAAVLRDNYLQGEALSLAEARGISELDRQFRLIRDLERSGRLDRALEFLPDDETIAVRAAAGRGLVRPELSVLLAYAKLALDAELLRSDLPDAPELAAELVGYFPQALRDRLASQIAAHPLRREITATVVTNDLVNRAGITFVTDMQARTGRPASEAARAYLIVRDSFDLRGWWARIEALDDKLAARVQLEMLVEIVRLIEQAAAWLLRARHIDLARDIPALTPQVAQLRVSLGEALPETDRSLLDERRLRLVAGGVPDALAAEIAGAPFLAFAPEIAELAAHSGRPLDLAARVYFAVGARFALDDLRAVARRLPAESSWQKLAVEAMTDDLLALQADLALRILTAEGAGEADPVAGWAAQHAAGLAAAEALSPEMRAAPPILRCSSSPADSCGTHSVRREVAEPATDPDRAPAAALRRSRPVGLPVWILIGAAAGVAAGVVFGERAAILKPLGSAYAMMLQIAVYPYLLCSLLWGLGRLQPAMARRLLASSWAVYLLMWSLTFGAIWLISRAIPPPPPPVVLTPQSAQRSAGVLDLLIPANVFEALGRNYVPAVVIFAIVYGVAVQNIAKKAALFEVLEAIKVASVTIWRWIVRFAPIGVFALFAAAAGTIEPDRMGGLLLYVALFLLGTLLLAFAVLPAVISAIAPASHREILRELRPALVLALVTTLSVVALPFVQKAAEDVADRAGCPPGEERADIIQASLSLSYVLAQLGNYFLYLLMLFAAYLHHLRLTVPEQLLLPLWTLLSGFGSPTATVDGVAFLAAWLRLPANVLELFLETWTVTRYGQVALSVIGFGFATILVPLVYFRRLRLRWRRLACVLGASAGLFAGVAVGGTLLRPVLLPQPTDALLPLTLDPALARAVTVTVKPKPSAAAGGSREPTLLPNAAIEIVPDYSVLPRIASRIDGAIWTLEQAKAWAAAHPGFTAVEPAGTGSPILLAYLLPPGAGDFRQYLDQWLELKAADGFRAAQIDYWIDGEPRARRRPRWNLLDALVQLKDG